ncbi:MAG: hypothetical protein K1X72_13980 [Pyrinomonadaceae bacterium]|nr:hypothetical protein [Pyrinomonadaceae bacterium]
MAFTDFKTVGEVQKKYSIKYQQENFVAINPFQASQTLLDELQFAEKYIDVRVSEMAIRENIIFPILREIYRQYAETFSLWSHQYIRYDDVLLGTPDYFLSKRSELGKTVLEPPFLLFSEAKKNDFDAGWGQCLAEMYSAQKMNEQEYGKILTIFGIVTDGQTWQFGKLAENIYTYNFKIFTLDDLNELLGGLDFVHQEMSEQIKSL